MYICVVRDVLCEYVCSLKETTLAYVICDLHDSK